ncbi:transposase [Zooshikella sp. RANM57]|uniref:transposase n=1 Tax=Zooshikella sp. RANM57 TaxID=3425863 RepID=UPI003D6FAFF9
MHYSTDLTDKQWKVLTPLLPKTKWQPGSRGRPPVDRRTVIDGILYVVKTGCQLGMYYLFAEHSKKILHIKSRLCVFEELYQ